MRTSRPWSAACLALGLLAAPVTAGTHTLDFSATPGPDGVVGTGDDTPIVGVPGLGGELVGDEFAALGILFSTPDLQLNVGCGNPDNCLGADRFGNDFTGRLVATFTDGGAPAAVSAISVTVSNDFNGSFTQLFAADGSVVAQFVDSFSYAGPTPVARVQTNLATDAWRSVTFTLAGGTAPWCDLGLALAGTAGKPSLAGTGPLTVGSSNALVLADAPPGAVAYVVLGFAAQYAPLEGGLLVPTLDLVRAYPVDGAGGLTLPFTWPAGIPAGTELYLQAWTPDPGGPSGWAASNGLQGVAQ